MTIRVEEERHIKLKPLGPNHEDMVLTLNNSHNNLHYVSQGENGFALFQSDQFWKYGESMMRMGYELGNRYKYYNTYNDCKWQQRVSTTLIQ